MIQDAYISLLSPSVVLIMTSILLMVLPKHIFRALATLAPIVALFSWMKIFLRNFTVLDNIKIGNIELKIFEINNYTASFSLAFILVMIAGIIFAQNKKYRAEIIASFLYAGSALQVIFAGDFLTLVIFSELMVVGATIIIWCGRSEISGKAGLIYAVTHLFAGGLMATSLALQFNQTGGFAIPNANISYAMFQDFSIFAPTMLAQTLFFFSLIIIIACPPFSFWLSESYPESSPSGSVFLSAFTTKVAFFLLLSHFAGSSIFLILGTVMILYGAIYALFEDDLRRALCFLIINQLGILVLSIGFDSALAWSAAAILSFGHILYQSLLMMCFGAIYYITELRDISILSGIRRVSLTITITSIIGLYSLFSMPFSLSFYAKSILVSLSAGTLEFYQLLIHLSNFLVILTGIKIFRGVYLEDYGHHPQKELKLNMIFGLALLALFSLIPIVFSNFIPEVLDIRINYDHTSFIKLFSSVIILVIAYSFYLIFKARMFVRAEHILDLDEIIKNIIVTLFQNFVKLFDFLVNPKNDRKLSNNNNFLLYHLVGNNGILTKYQASKKTAHAILFVILLALILLLV